MKRLFFCAVLSCLLTLPLLVFAASAEAQGPIIGEIRLWPSTDIPSGWLYCGGDEIPVSSYPELALVISDTFCADPPLSGYFCLPNFEGRFPYGQYGGIFPVEIGDTGGEAEHTLTEAEMPSHNHDIGDGVSNGYVLFRDHSSPNKDTTSYGAYFSAGYIQDAGGDQPHNNLPPYIGISYIIAYTATNITPTPTITPTATPTPTSTPVITGSVPYVSAYTQTLTSGNELVVPVYVTFGNIFVIGVGFLILASFLLSMLVRVTK